MKNQDVLTLYNVIQSLKSKDGLPLKFSWALIKTDKIIKKELIETIQEVTKPHEKASELDGKRIELCKEYASVDSNGKHIMEGNSYTFSEHNRAKFDEAYSKLADEYKDVIEHNDSNAKKLESILEDTCEFELYKVKLEYVPDNLKPSEIEALECMIDDT